MWQTEYYPFKNLFYKLFWKPKKNIIYRNKSSTRYSHGNAGYLLGTVTEVYFVVGEKYRYCFPSELKNKTFIDKNGNRKICSFKINDKNKVSVKIGKKIKVFDISDLSFSKHIERSYYWGEGGGSVRKFIFEVKPKN